MTAVQIGALALSGGTLTGALTVPGRPDNHRGWYHQWAASVAADGATLDAHVVAKDNPHGVTALFRSVPPWRWTAVP